MNKQPPPTKMFSLFFSFKFFLKRSDQKIGQKKNMHDQENLTGVGVREINPKWK